MSYTVTYADANFGFSNLTASAITLNRTGSANGIISLTGSGTTYTVTIGGISGTGSLGISVAPATAVDQAGNLALPAGPSATFVVDNMPVGINISGPSKTITNNAPITYTVTYSALDSLTSNLSASDVHLVSTGTATGTLSFDTGTGATRTITVTPTGGNGSLGITIDEGSAVDLAGNVSPAARSSTFVVDNTAPTVTIGGPASAYTATGPITYTVTYADAYFASSSLTASNVTLNATGTASGTVNVTGSGTSYRVTINNIIGNGTLSISLPAGTAVDQAGNKAPAASSAVVTVDNTPVGISVSGPSATLAGLTPVTYTVTYIDADFASSNLTAANVHLISTGGATGTLSFDNSTGTTRTITVTPTSGTGTLAIAIDAGSGVDLAGNVSPASGTSASFTAYTTPVAVTVSKPSVTTTVAGTVKYTVTFSDPHLIANSTVLTPADVLLLSTNSNQAANIAVANTGSTATTSTWTVTISGITGGKGVAGIAVLAGAALDSAGNTNLQTAESTTFKITGAERLTLASSYATSILAGNTLSYTLKITNAGNQLAQGVAIQETPPAGTTVDLSANPGWSLGADGISYVYDIGNLAAGKSVTLTFKVSVSSTVAPGTVLHNAVAVMDAIGLEVSTNLNTTIKQPYTGRWIPK